MKNEEKLRREQNSLIYRFIKYDDQVIRPKIIPNWPEVKEDNNNVSRKIKKALGLWAEQKEKYHTCKENDTIQFNLPGFHIGGDKDKEKERPETVEEENENEKIDVNKNKNNYNNKEKKKIELNDIITNEDEK